MLRRTGPVGRAVLAVLAVLAPPACFIVAGGCARHTTSPQRGFYYWRTAFAPSGPERQVLAEHDVTRLYIRFFDVAWDAREARSAPVAPCTFPGRVPDRLEVVPVVYLVNDVFVHEKDPPALADDAWRLLHGTAQSAGIAFREIQLDCDWSERTRAAFFAFCARMREHARGAGAQLSATIRLHQVKYRARTGIPPVDRGALMFYNVGRLDAQPERSPIFNVEDAQRYAPFIGDYPLPLDVALPVFSWGIQSREGRVVGLISKPDAGHLAKLPALRRTSPASFVAVEATFFDGNYMQRGDTLVLDGATPAVAHEAAALLARHLRPRGPFTIILFDLDERNLARYAREDLDDLFAALR